MTTTEHLLSCVSEESAEISQEVSKMLRFGPGQPCFGGPTNAERIMIEVYRLMAVVTMLIERGVLTIPSDVADIMIAKQDKVREYMLIAKKQGTITD